MLDYFNHQKPRINTVLQDFLEDRRQSLNSHQRWSEDVFRRLQPFAANGKMIRGGLTMLGHQMYNGQLEDAALRTGAAMELLQTAFLIHDDVMDQDSLRRGAKTIFQQYLEWGRQQAMATPKRFGEAMAICIGDIAFFLAFELLNQIPVEDNLRQAVNLLTLHETAKVGLGQMQDVYLGFCQNTVSEEEIFQVFSSKTATYTFILPLQAGATLAGQNPATLSELREFGETMGVIFQIRDDELGLFGEEQEIGKPVGTDIRQGKKTLFHLYLMQQSNPAEVARLNLIFGNSSADLKDVQWIRQRVVELGIRDQLQQKTEQMAGKAREQLQQLSFPVEPCRDILRQIIDYNLNRKK